MVKYGPNQFIEVLFYITILKYLVFICLLCDMMPNYSIYALTIPNLAVICCVALIKLYK